jgi:hypothetical protein
MSSESPSQPGKAKWALPGSRSTGSPDRTASGTAASTPATSSSRSALTRATVSCRADTAVSVATASPTIAAVLTVPERTSRSWPPPCSSGAQSTSRPSTRAPAPTGPPSLCPVRVSASTPATATSTGSTPTACTASVWNGTPCSAATAASAATGCTVPTSLLAHITETIATVSGPASSSAARSVSGCTRPCRSTGSQLTSAPSCRTSHSTESTTAWCSTALASTRRRRGSAARRAQ